jgi:hypothetical protein
MSSTSTLCEKHFYGKKRLKDVIWVCDLKIEFQLVTDECWVDNELMIYWSQPWELSNSPQHFQNLIFIILSQKFHHVVEISYTFLLFHFMNDETTNELSTKKKRIFFLDWSWQMFSNNWNDLFKTSSVQFVHLHSIVAQRLCLCRHLRSVIHCVSHVFVFSFCYLNFCFEVKDLHVSGSL